MNREIKEKTGKKPLYTPDNEDYLMLAFLAYMVLPEGMLRLFGIAIFSLLWLAGKRKPGKETDSDHSSDLR